MDYRKFGESYYIRLDKGDEIITSLLDICGKEGISSATFYGIGGCSSAEIQTFIPESGRLTHHTHALFSYKQDGAHLTSGGHIKSITVLYTAEIELRPVVGGIIRKKKDPITGTGFWNFD